MRSDKEIRELINLYLLGALDSDEKAVAKDYLKQAEYLKYYNETRFMVDHTAYSYEDDTPVPDNLKSDIMSKLDNIVDESQTESERDLNYNVIRPSFFNRYGYAIAASVVGFLLIYTFTLTQQLKEQRLQIAKLQTESSESHHFVDFVNNPDVFQVKLAADDKSQALGNLAWNKSSNDAMLYVSNLKELQENNVYQVWVVNKDNSVIEAMGTFNVNPDGTFMLIIECMPKPSDTKAIFITMEPDVGMPHPTGYKCLSGYI